MLTGEWTRSVFWGVRFCSCITLSGSSSDSDMVTSLFRWSFSGWDQRTEGQDLAAIVCFALLIPRHLCSGGPPVDEIQHHKGQDLAAVLCFAPLTQWHLCSGGPPVDEINILRGEILLLQNQVMYERHKRSNHAMRNRRLLRRIAHVSALEEQVQALVRILVRRVTSTWQRNRVIPFPALERCKLW